MPTFTNIYLRHDLYRPILYWAFITKCILCSCIYAPDLRFCETKMQGKSCANGTLPNGII